MKYSIDDINIGDELMNFTAKERSLEIPDNK
jgi:hypothetical protein